MTHITDTSASDLRALERSLERDAQAIINAKAGGCWAKKRTFLVCDFEYRFRREAHAAWAYGRKPERDRNDRVQAPKIHWPFHDVAAASWMVMRFDARSDVPELDAPVVMSLEAHSETEVLRGFFEALDGVGREAQMITWGGEARDLSVLRFQACRRGLSLPVHLRDTSPYARERIDLCRSTTVQADPVHLDEYASGCGIPSKSSPPCAIGKLAECGQWASVHDHVLADVMTTSVVALNWLTAMGEIACNRERSAMAITDAALTAFPGSPFLQRDFKPWARDRLRAASLRGAVYRAVETA